MKPKNFPGRKFQRQLAAEMRETGSRVASHNVTVPAGTRAIRTKKKRG